MIWTPSTPWDREAAKEEGMTYVEYRRWIRPYRIALWMIIWGMALALVGLCLLLADAREALFG